MCSTSPPGQPCLPLPVLEQAQRDLVALPGRRHVGDGDQPSVQDVRGHPCASDCRHPRAGGRAGELPVLFLQGGASLQFSMVPMNLLGAGRRRRLHRHRLVGRKAIKEAKRVGTVNVTGSTKADNYNRIPAQSELQLTPGAAYVHITTNNTIEGTEWKTPARGRRRAARGRRVVRHLQRADRRRPLRPHLRRRAEEPRAVRRDARDHSRGSARPLGRRACRRC